MQIEVILCLPVLDFLATLMKIGLGEASLSVRWLMQVDPAVGLAVSKLVAFALGGLCLWLHKRHLVRWINYWYAGLVVWNMVLVFGVLRAG